VSLEYHKQCNGTNCPTNSPIIDCVYTSNFTGRKLPDQGTVAQRSEPGK